MLLNSVIYKKKLANCLDLISMIIKLNYQLLTDHFIFVRAKHKAHVKRASIFSLSLKGRSLTVQKELSTMTSHCGI